MSGHSKWSKVKHKKAGTDAKRGALFSKLSRVISVAAGEGGADPKTNAKLRQAIDQARASGLPKENIERAISRAGKTGKEANLVSREYEAYGPQGSAFLILAVTDNINRTLNELKAILAASGGKLGESGSVSWMFERKAVMEFAAPPSQTQEIELALIEAGAEDINVKDNRIQAVAAAEKLDAFLRGVNQRGLSLLNTSQCMLPKNIISPDQASRQKILALKKNLEDHPDVTEVWTNIKT